MDFKNTIKTALPLAAVALCLGFGANQAQAGALYSDIPNVDVHLGHENTSFAGSPANSGITSFGSLIRPETGYLYYVTAALSNYATAAQYSGQGDASGYDVSLQLNLYNAGTGTGTSPDRTYALGSLIDSSSTTAHIAWRPSGNTLQTCGGTNENAYNTGGGPTDQSCGQLNMVNFDFAGNPLINGDVIWQLTINGKGVGNAQDSLNWALSDGTFTALEGDTGNFTSASNPEYGTNYLNGVGTTGYGAISTWSEAGQGEIAFGTPEPATFGLIGLGLVGLGFAARRKNKV